MVAGLATACGTQHINVPENTPEHAGAVVFSERCGGCHTLSYAGTHGSAPNIRTAQAISGPNFNQRCERPIARVLYAIANGGFSGAYMPQNVVVGQDAVDVARFVATYAGREAPREPGVIPCQQLPIGTLPPGSGTTKVASVSSTTSSSSSSGTTKTGAKHRKAKSAAAGTAAKRGSTKPKKKRAHT